MTVENETIEQHQISRKVFIVVFMLFAVVSFVYFLSSKPIYLWIYNFNNIEKREGLFNNSLYNFSKIKNHTKSGEVSLIGGFYHFSTIKDHWKNIVMEQMILANHSELARATSNIYVTGLGPLIDNGGISAIFSGSKYIYEYKHNQSLLYEFPTLKKLERFCLENNHSFVWYAHSKGASRPLDFATNWRGLLNYFVLYKWQMCYELLASTNHTTCSAILTFDSMRKDQWNTYYAGNMWWAKCSHVNRLTRIKDIDQADRDMAELYVTSEPAVGHFNCFNIALSHIQPSVYKDANCSVNQPLWKIR